MVSSLVKSFNLALRAAGFALVFTAFGGQASASVPEIDPGSAVSAVTLAVTGMLILTGSMRRRS
jgi:hypothetical protein